MELRFKTWLWAAIKHLTMFYRMEEQVGQANKNYINEVKV